MRVAFAPALHFGDIKHSRFLLIIYYNAKKQAIQVDIFECICLLGHSVATLVIVKLPSWLLVHLRVSPIFHPSSAHILSDIGRTRSPFSSSSIVTYILAPSTMDFSYPLHTIVFLNIPVYIIRNFHNFKERVTRVNSLTHFLY